MYILCCIALHAHKHWNIPYIRIQMGYIIRISINGGYPYHVPRSTFAFFLPSYHTFLIQFFPSPRLQADKEPYKINSGAKSEAKLPAVYRAHHNARILCVMEHPTLKTRQNSSLLLDVQCKYLAACIFLPAPLLRSTHNFMYFICASTHTGTREQSQFVFELPAFFFVHFGDYEHLRAHLCIISTSISHSCTYFVFVLLPSSMHFRFNMFCACMFESLE